VEKAKILIIEDEIIVAHDLADLLSQWEYEVVGTASSGEEAVEMAQVTNPNLVLADIKLEGSMDGIEAAERINENADCAVIYLTARTESDIFERAKESAPYGYITKPVAPQELLRTVEMALYKYEMENRLRKSETRFRAIFDQTFQFIGLMTPEGILLEANRAALDFYGLTESEVIGLPFWETPWWTHSTEQQERLREAIKKAAAGEFVRFEAFHPAPDGALRYVDVSIKPVTDDQGNVSLLIPEGRDITDQKIAQNRLADLNLIKEDLLTVSDIETKLRRITDGVVEVFDADFARIWMTGPGDRCDSGCVHAEVTEGPHVCRNRDRCLHLVASSGRYTHTDGQTHRRVPFGCYKIGRVASGEIPKFLTNEVTEDPNVHDHDWATSLGLVSFAGYRLLSSDMEPVGVLGLFAQHTLSDDEDILLEGLANTTAQVIQTGIAEGALKDSEVRYRQMAENSLMGVFIQEYGPFSYVNNRLTEMLGYQPEEMIGKHILEFVHPDDRELVHEKKVKRVHGLDVPTHYEFRALCKDGGFKWLEIYAASINYQGRSVIMGNVMDITQRKKAEEELRVSDEFNRSLVEYSPMAIVSFNKDGIIEYTNPASNRIFGVPEGQESPLLGFKIFDLPPIAEQPNMLQSFQRLMQGQPISELEIAYRSPFTGRDYVLLASATPRIASSGSVNGAITMFMDITESKRAAIAIKDSEQRLTQIINFLPDATFVVDLEGRVVVWNRAIERLTGVKAEDILGKDNYEHALPFYGERRPVLIDLVNKRDEGIEGTYAFVKEEGEMLVSETPPKTLKLKDLHLWNVAGPLYDEQGEVIGAIESIRDITERKRIEEALAESEERFRTAFQTSPDSININRLDDGVYIDINEGFTTITGYQREEVIGRSSSDINIWHEPKDRERLVEGLRKDGYVRNLETSFCYKDGRVRTGLMSASVVLLDGVPHILSVSRDIEDWKRTLDALRLSEQRLELALTGADLGLWDWNLKTGKAVWSERMEGMLGYAQTGIEPDLRSWKRQVHPEDWPNVSEVLNRHLEGSLPFFEIQYRNQSESGRWKWIQARGKVVEHDDEGNPLRMTGTALDITESKRLQEQLIQAQKMEAVGTLAGGIAHDVNNLLQVMLGQADMLLLRGGMEEKFTRSVEAIRQSARSGADLVKRILAFSREAETEMRPVNLSDEVLRIQRLLRRTIPRMISIEMNLEDRLWMISADPSQLEQVILNLAVNAKDAMPDGGRLVFETRNETLREEYSRLQPEVKPGKYVLMTVFDTGLGIEKEILDRIFEPFFTTKQPGEGTGLGLSMAFGIVKGHGGHISCYSELGLGTTFKIYFPVAEMDLPAAVADTIEMPAGGTETLLLVDDEESLRKLGVEMLELAGYTVLTATNGREALQVYSQRKDQIALVILDLVMPEMGGRQCLEELRRMDPSAKVLIASGYSANGPTKDALDRGAIGFINKPFDLKQILLAVRKSLDASREKS